MPEASSLLPLSALPRTPPRLSLNSSKRPPRKSARPATAPPHDHESLLPSSSSLTAHSMGIPDPPYDYSTSLYKGKSRDVTPYMQTVDENDGDRVSGLGLGKSSFITTP